MLNLRQSKNSHRARLSHLILIVVLVTLILPNVSHASLLNPFSWDWTDKCAGFFNPTCAGGGAQVGAPLSSGNVYLGGTGVAGFLAWILTMLRLIFPLIVSVAVVWFIYNVFQYTIYDTEKDKNEVREKLVWGIVAIFVMVSVWGLVGILQGTFRLDNKVIKAPGIQTSI